MLDGFLFSCCLHDVDHGIKKSTFVNESNSYHDHVFRMLQIYVSNRQRARSWNLMRINSAELVTIVIAHGLDVLSAILD